MKKYISSLLIATLIFTSMPMTPVNALGDTVKLSANYDTVGSFTQGTAVVSKDGKWGGIDVKGREIIPLIFDEMRGQGGEVLAVRKDGEWGYIGVDGSGIAAIQYEDAKEFKNGFGYVKKKGKWTCLDKSGNMVTPTVYDELGNFSSEKNTIAPFMENDKWGYINIKGEEVVPPTYDYAWDTAEGRAVVMKVNQYGVIDLEGNEIVPPTFEEALYYSEGLLTVRQEGRYGVIDKNGKTIIPFKYDKIGVFSEGLVSVKEANLYGYADKNGKVVVPIKYNEVWPFSRGYAKVRLGNKIGFVDSKGTEITELKYEDAHSFADGLAAVKQDGKWGFIDGSGKEVIAVTYDTIGGLGMSEDLSAVRTGDKWELIPNTYTKATTKPEEPKTEVPKTEVPKTEVKPEPDSVYKYNIPDLGKDIALPLDSLELVVDQSTLKSVIKYAIDGSTEEQKKSPTGIDLMTAFAERAITKLSSKTVAEAQINIDKAMIDKLKGDTMIIGILAETALVSNGIGVQRNLNQNPLIKTSERGKITVTIEKSAMDRKLDYIEVETPFALVSISTDTNIGDKLQFTLEDKGETGVQVDFIKGSGEMKLALPNKYEDVRYLTVVDESGSPLGGKYNPITETMDTKIQKSGVYSIKENIKNFSDISAKSKEVQEAIKILAAKGIVNGTKGDRFSPDATISRAEVAALVMRCLSKPVGTDNGGFKDVKPNSWYYGVAGSAKKYGIINGYADKTFRGGAAIPKDQIVSIFGRVLKSEMGYKAPKNPESNLAIYKDSKKIASWSKSDVALSTLTGIVVERKDGNFDGSGLMTRGDAAVLIKRLMDRIW